MSYCNYIQKFYVRYGRALMYMDNIINYYHEKKTLKTTTILLNLSLLPFLDTYNCNNYFREHY